MGLWKKVVWWFDFGSSFGLCNEPSEQKGGICSMIVINTYTDGQEKFLCEASGLFFWNSDFFYAKKFESEESAVDFIRDPEKQFYRLPKMSIMKIETLQLI